MSDLSKKNTQLCSFVIITGLFLKQKLQVISGIVTNKFIALKILVIRNIFAVGV